MQKASGCERFCYSQYKFIPDCKICVKSHIFLRIFSFFLSFFELEINEMFFLGRHFISNLNEKGGSEK